jgi:site-specific recombinase XerD
MRVQRVAAVDGGAESWTALDEAFAVVEPVDEYLAYLTVIERSPGTVRSYAFDLRDYFEFLAAHEIDWRTVRLEHLGRFVGWLRLTPDNRLAAVTSLAVDAPHCSAVTINRKLAAVGSFYTYHHRHGVNCGDLLTDQRIKKLTEENTQLRAQLAIAYGQRRAGQIITSRTPSTTQSPRS